eukprot:3418339-Pyramimonas_sp.AAC.1
MGRDEEDGDSETLEDEEENPASPLGVGGLGSFLFHLPCFPFGEGFTPLPNPSPGPGRARSRAVRMSKMAQDGCMNASDSPR